MSLAAARVHSDRVFVADACRRSRFDAARLSGSAHSMMGPRRMADAKAAVLPCWPKAGPHRQRASACSCDVGDSIGFCRSLCSSCQQPDSVRLDAHIRCSPASFCSIRESYGRFRISSGRARDALRAMDRLQRREHKAFAARFCVASFGRAVVECPQEPTRAVIGLGPMA